MTSVTDTKPSPQARMSGPERREQILDATGEIIGARGFGAVSVESVAAAAGISRPIVYGHFGGLDGLIEALIDRESERATKQLAEFLPQDLGAGDPVEQLLGGLRGYLEAVRANPFTWKLILIPQENAPEALQERISESRAAVMMVLAEAFRPGLGPGREVPDPELAAHAASSLSDGYARLVLTDPDAFTVDRILAQARWFTDLVDLKESPS